jgi:hypothetical protein
MGCDIHLYKEKFIAGKWVTADEWESYDYGDDDKGSDVPFEKRFTDRNYNLFGLLCKGVRREYEFSFTPRGFPLTASPEVSSIFDDCDDHNHSYLFLHELRELHTYLQTHKLSISGMKNKAELAALQASIASDSPDWSLLYPYCQMTNDERQEEFAVDVPASFIVGEGLEKIIASFDGIDGDNHRIVFWFDN